MLVEDSSGRLNNNRNMGFITSVLVEDEIKSLLKKYLQAGTLEPGIVFFINSDLTSVMKDWNILYDFVSVCLDKGVQMEVVNKMLAKQSKTFQHSLSNVLAQHSYKLASTNWYRTITSGKKEVIEILEARGKLNDEALNYCLSIPLPKIQTVAAFFYGNNNLNEYLQKLQTLDQKQKIKRLFANIKFLEINGEKIEIQSGARWTRGSNWIKFTEIIDGMFNSVNLKNNKKLENINTAPIATGKNIQVFKADGKEACKVLGKGTSWCIARQGAGNMYYGYRANAGSTFYFIIDNNRELDDPLHRVVVDVQANDIQLTDLNNTTGTIEEFGADYRSYYKYLSQLGVNSEIFKNSPKTPEELKDEEIIGQYNSDLAWFKSLPYEYKEKYIETGMPLTHDQLKLIVNNNADELVSTYLGMGHVLQDEDKAILKPKQIETNTRARLIYVEALAQQSPYNFSSDDIDFLYEHNLDEIKNEIFSLSHIPDIYINQIMHYKDVKYFSLDFFESMNINSLMNIAIQEHCTEFSEWLVEVKPELQDAVVSNYADADLRIKSMEVQYRQKNLPLSEKPEFVKDILDRYAQLKKFTNQFIDYYRGIRCEKDVIEHLERCYRYMTYEQIKYFLDLAQLSPPSMEEVHKLIYSSGKSELFLRFVVDYQNQIKFSGWDYWLAAMGAIKYNYVDSIIKDLLTHITEEELQRNSLRDLRDHEKTSLYQYFSTLWNIDENKQNPDEIQIDF